MNYLVLLSAGKGSRLNSVLPKQYISINGKSIFEYTISAFINSQKIDKIVIVANKDFFSLIEEKLKSIKIPHYVIEGGETGLLSAYNGFKFIKDNFKANKDDLVLFHDAARPFIDKETIIDNINIASKYGNAVATIPLSETLIKKDDDYSSNKKVSRDNLLRVLTPHTFSIENLYSFYSNYEDIKESKEPSIFAYYMDKGNTIHYSKSSERNFKITYDNDLELAIQLLSSKE